MRAHLRSVRLGALLAVGLVAGSARAIPPFARKYGTSCETCHTVYPKLNAFGEAFRRRGFRFPGVDSDAVKQDAVPLGQEAHKQVFPGAVWPGLLPGSTPLGLSVDGQVVAHPDVRSGGGQADDGAPISLRDLVGEAHLWAGGSFDDRITFFGQLTVTTRGAVDLENAEVHVNDLFGPAGLVNLVVGKAAANLTSFGAHSSYLADTLLPSVPVAALFGATTDGFRLGASAPGLELNGVVLERLTWALGVAAGAALDLRPTENAWAHAGVLLGDGEGGFWRDASVAVDVFAHQATSRFSSAAGTPTFDVGLVLGGALRVQWKAVELDAGFYAEGHSHAQADNPDLADPARNGALLLVQYDELSWLVFPWLVPALRVEYLRASPQGAAAAWDLRIVPGVSVLFRQNLKAVLTAQFESASGMLPAGWSRGGGFAAPTADRPTVNFENESVVLNLAAAF